jgi:hypothetical protein
VTGKGRIVSLVVKQSPGPNATKGQRFLYAFPLKLTNKYKSRRVDVYVDEDGNAFQLGSTQSLDAFTKLRNWIKPASLMQEGDLTKNLATIGTHVAAITAATMVPALIPVEIGAGLIHIAYVHKSAVALAHSANETAIGATTEWASKLVDAGHAPNVAEAYSFYLGKLDEGGTGAQPVNAVEFARLFAAQGM